MRILFLANPVSGLYKDIEEELIRQGHDVVTVIDKFIRFDPFFHNTIHFPFRKLLWKYQCDRYWNAYFLLNKKMSVPFDILFLLSGVSASQKLIIKLKEINSNIKVVLYTWDGCGYYSFDRHFPYVDKAYTFDIEDVKRDPRWALLPIYCRKKNVSNEYHKKIDLFMVGSNHDSRSSFVKKIIPQLSKMGINYYIKIYTPTINRSFFQNMIFHIHLLFNRSLRNDYLFASQKENSDLIMTEVLPSNEYNMLQDSASCILDDQREGQSGLTARFMWALADKKKIITTNKWAYDYSFVSKKQVEIISKSNPIFPVDFIKRELKDSDYSIVSDYNISKWLYEIIDF